MNFLYFIGAIGITGVAIYLATLLGFYVSCAMIVGIMAARVVYKLWDGKKENDWELILIGFAAIAIIALLISQDSELIHIVNGAR